jgi:phosphatidylglycerol---prolipoprotein diacylglyceryl transferase
MSYPYLTDILNAVFATDWAMPIPTFGVLVALAFVVATRVARANVRRLEALGRLPPSTHLVLADVVFVAALAGFAGARLFHILDNPSQFMANPMAMVFSRAGFSIYGGLLAGAAAGVVFLRRRGLPVAAMLDAMAPSMMIGYAIGRLGCQLSGDGDWGIAADMALKPGWMPDWWWAQTYDGNILQVVIPQPGVYPTPLYESLTALLLFGVLCALRSVTPRPGHLFSVYLLLAGFERLLIEKIRVNPRHDWLGIGLTQAEVISVLFILGGLLGMVLSLRGRRLWPRIVLVTGVGVALSACVPL